ncbi:MAG: GNAT family N-acetyltransferase [Betaproteobacteria bacterium]
MSEGGLLPHCADAGLQLTESHVRAAYGRGDLCVAAFDGDYLVGYQWFAFGPTPHIDGVWVDFNTSVRYGYKQFVRPEYRGRHIAAGLSTHCDRTCVQRGCLRTVSFIDLENDASWRATSRLGSRAVGYAGYVSLFGLFFAFRTAGARVCGFRFYVPIRSQSSGRFASSAEMRSFTTD